MASQPDYPLLTAEEFLEIDFGERKAELDNGVIRMMAGGTARHAHVQGNIYASLRQRLQGSGCTPYNSDMAARTRDRSIRYPDVTVYCGRGGSSNDDEKAFDDPRIVFEVLSAGTARTDLRVKLEEYKELASIATIVFVDIATERLRIVQRTGTGWSETIHSEPADLALPSLDLTLPHDEIFARD
ncbi:Uma2 family endonuclease [Sphingomonas oligophenolica]|uniref:Uma2 family endonuclease n=1 Tax=Sphingomonas oligophenolica TaxID=301154 RepID=A0A502CPJ0_9SPHN|nr:Uma2 family endonuclease [Sphingomonas oligophenolica]TPG14450.1 Uma2 family endonuclease [Sphingomonas oligophenolica]